MIVIGTEQEINEKIKSLSKEKLLSQGIQIPEYKDALIRYIGEELRK